MQTKVPMTTAEPSSWPTDFEELVLVEPILEPTGANVVGEV